MPEQKDIHLYSNEVQEIISAKSGWVVRNGIMLFTIIIAAFIACTFFISYPDIIKAPVRIAGINAPKLLIAKSDGKIEQLLVKNDAVVDSGQTIAVIQSTTDINEVLRLEKWIDRIEKPVLKDSLEILQLCPAPVLVELGDIQQPYQDFRKALGETLQALGNGYYQEKKKALLRDLLLISDLNSSIRRQKAMMEKADSLQKVEYSANESLSKEKVIAPLELNKEKSLVLDREQSLEQMTATIINNATVDLSKKKEVQDLEKSIVDLKQNFQSALMNLKSKVAAWKDRYVISASEKGRVQFISFIQTNELLKTGQEVFYIIPEQVSYFAEIYAPQQNFGKVRLNQKVIIRLNSYPYNEFGVINGTVSYIPSVPFRDSVFLINVQLPLGLETSHKKILAFKNNLSGEAQIITEDHTLSDRILYQFRDLQHQR